MAWDLNGPNPSSGLLSTWSYFTPWQGSCCTPLNPTLFNSTPFFSPPFNSTPLNWLWINSTPFNWLSINSTLMNCIAAHMPNLSQVASCVDGQLPDAAGVSPPWLRKTSTKSLYMARICPPLSVGTMFVAMPAPFANGSAQFVVDMKRYEELTGNSNLKQCAWIRPSRALQYLLRVSACR